MPGSGRILGLPSLNMKDQARLLGTEVGLADGDPVLQTQNLPNRRPNHFQIPADPLD